MPAMSAITLAVTWEPPISERTPQRPIKDVPHSIGYYADEAGKLYQWDEAARAWTAYEGDPASYLPVKTAKV